MREVKWTNPALLDFEEIQNHIGLDNPTAAKRVTNRVREAADGLCRHPFSGRSIRGSQVRIRVVSGTPYLIVYRVTTAVEVLRLWHARRNWIIFQAE